MTRWLGVMFSGLILLNVGLAKAADGPVDNGPVEKLLWPNGAPGAVGTDSQDKPSLTLFPAPADKANGAAVVICPGGGYGHLATDHEGNQIAKWLNTLGVSGYVLKYRLAPRYRHPAPLQDVQRAIRTVRANAGEWKLDVNRIGVMGFSAGGHLASTAATHFDLGRLQDEDRINQSSCRPDFAILGYPVISFIDPSLHTGSRDNLIGGNDPYLIRYLSNETQVTPQTPPTFLWHTTEDRGVYPQNSILFYTALVNHGVPAEIHVYEKGRHGLGLSKDEPTTADWTERCAAWLKQRGLLNAERKPVFDDPATVSDPDFVVQGEYLGVRMGEKFPENVGVQVVALGKGKFEAVLFPGGLPGEGFIVVKGLKSAGSTKGGVTELNGEFTATIQRKTLTLKDSSGQEVAKLTRIERTSPTIGLVAPEGARVLFDGTTPFQFEKGRMYGEPLLPVGVTSRRKFKDCHVHLEFRTPFQPQDFGQKRGNSGCYLQGRYEVQILDSFGLKGVDHECGGVYEIHDPAVNMCFPPLAWQTYDIDYTAAKYDAAGKKTANARITVLHNGVKIQDNLELPRATRAAPIAEGPEPGPLYLQDHGNPVKYRNVWVVEK